MTRLWLLVRREVLMTTLSDYSTFFTTPFLFILLLFWLGDNALITDILGNNFIFRFVFFIFLPLVMYFLHLDSLFHGDWETNDLKILPHPLPRIMFPVKRTEKFIAEFFCYAVLCPLVIQTILSLPFFIFRVDFSIWRNIAIEFFTIYSPIIALKFLRIAIVEDTSIRRHRDSVPFLGKAIEWIFFGLITGSLLGDVLPLHYLGMVATIITVILWWATYRIRSKNATR